MATMDVFRVFDNNGDEIINEINENDIVVHCQFEVYGIVTSIKRATEHWPERYSIRWIDLFGIQGSKIGKVTAWFDKGDIYKIGTIEQLRKGELRPFYG